MATTPSQKPVASELPQDLKFNSGKIDEFVTSLAQQYIDRLGGKHYTIEGLRKLAFDAISGFGWILVESFQDGATLTLPNQALKDESSGEYYRWDGQLPKAVPVGSTPDSTGGVGAGAWVGIGDAALKTMLATSVGSSMIGMAAGGTLEQVVTWVTPEQFGAIGDGTAHPLSERYSTLAAAQAVYPFVTSLSQTIDWAACQAADNYARGKSIVKSPRLAFYHLGSNYLKLSINSKWDSGFSVSNDFGQCPIFTRNIQSTKPSYGQYCIVRVEDSSEAGSPDEFVRGVVFKGYCLTYGLPSRAAAKATERFCLHLNYAINSEVVVAVKGGEFGVYGYSCWGGSGTLIIDSCHKAFYADPVTPTPENLTPPPNSNTSFNYKIKIDACPFGLVLRSCQYSKFSGYIEGAVVGFAIYDNANETAVAITTVGCVNNSFFIGVEAWTGIIHASSNSTTTTDLHLNSGHPISNSTGSAMAWATIIALTGGVSPFTLPSGNKMVFCSVDASRMILRGLDADMSGTPYDVCYPFYISQNARIICEGTKIYIGSNRNIANANLVNLDIISDPYLEVCMWPEGSSNYKYLGRGVVQQLSPTLAGVTSDGTATVTPPAGWKILSSEALVLTSSSAQTTDAAIAVKSYGNNGSNIVYQTAKSTSFSINYRLMLQITK